jgi:hypothetical protein
MPRASNKSAELVIPSDHRDRGETSWVPTNSERKPEVSSQSNSGGVTCSPPTLTLMESRSVWREQYDRMRRGLMVVEKYYGGRTGMSTFGAENVFAFRDDVIHLFQDIFHLRDWLMNEASADLPRQELHDLFIDHPADWPDLHIARDVAISAKHLKIDRPSMSDSTAVASSSRVAVKPGASMEEGVFQQNIYVEDGRRKRDALELAKACVKAWDNYLTSRGLL